MAGNPCAEKDDFLTFVAAFLLQITYYQYKLIPDEERIIGLEEHRYSFNKNVLFFFNKPNKY